jgi:hypothetical protein
MTIINQNNVSGIVSITAQNSSLDFYDSAGNTLQIGADVSGTLTGSLGVVTTTSAGNLTGNLGVTTTDKIGIGTVSAIGKLESWSIVQSTAASKIVGRSCNLRLVDSNQVSADMGGGIVFSYVYRSSDGQSLIQGPYIKAVKSNAVDGEYGGGLAFGVREQGNSGQTEGFRIRADGDTVVSSGNSIRMANGNVVFETAGTGLDFTSTAVSAGSSISARVLDDYEEGFFKPTLRFGGNSIDMTYNNSGLPTECREGYYTKVGRLVTCFLRLEITAKGSSTGAAVIQGLPFTVGSVMTSTSVQGSATVGFVDGVSATHTDFSMHPWEGTAELRLYYKATDSGAPVAATSTQLDNDFDFRATFSYMVD